jgi:hypothetical protein
MIAETCQLDFKETYEIRSGVAHMRGVMSRVPGDTRTEQRRRLLFRTIQAEALARYCLANFLGRETLWPYFYDDAAIDAFWKLPELKRRNAWGSKLELIGVSR